ncbi:MAG: SUMF1/EgtB/PvdO family nonheme iron enzyme [Polyangiaceae bacterium]|nr:SUMF1/EgtB/PvdO family nonheme iron enzyme [Polyangiaceae bacterium]
MLGRRNWLVALAALAVACGGARDGSDGAPGANGTPGADGAQGEDGADALIVPTAIEAGADCMAGGVQVQSGMDANGDGELQGEEIRTTDFVCHGLNGADGGSGSAAGGAGAAGADGLTSLVAVTAVDPGPDCVAGGQRLEAGLDSDRSGTLEANEVTTTRLVCNGRDGAATAQGDPGRDSLIVTHDELGGANCESGGKRIDVGTDADHDALLATGEITSTVYVCNGADGAPGADGADGAPGADGADGAPGADGADGADGAPGADGADGASGADGADGADGAPGADGLAALSRTVAASGGPGECYGVGGIRVMTGLDENADGALADGEVTSATTVCEGTPLADPPSCTATTAPCQGESCCMTEFVPGGSFLMGRGTEAVSSGTLGCATSHTCGTDEVPEHEVFISRPFYLDKYEVTVGRMREFVAAYDHDAMVGALNAGAGRHPRIGAARWQSAFDGELPAEASALATTLACHADQTWTNTAGANETAAINCVDWYTAFAFCAWDGGRLPTSAEWEFAAAGGTENRYYPWGGASPSNVGYANWLSSTGSPVLAVGSKPNGLGRWGQLDLAGSMWEFVSDVYSATWYAQVGASGTDVYAGLPAVGDSVVIRGGSFVSVSSNLRAAEIHAASAAMNQRHVGLRCARDADDDVPGPGAPGADGADGAEGLSALVSVSDEPMGSHCLYGGKTVQTGLDADRDGVLDAGEVNGSATTYLCEAAPADGPEGKACDEMGTVAGRRCGSRWVDGGPFCPQGDCTTPWTMPGFYLDRYEVVVSRFRRFVASGDWVPATGSGASPLYGSSGGWRQEWAAMLPTTTAGWSAALNCYPLYASWTGTAGSREAVPLNCLNWYEAFAFCAWDGGYLPSEEQWLYAASGGDENRIYAWGGGAPTLALAIYGDCGDGDCATASRDDLRPAGSTPGGNGRWGHSDLTGSLWEYVASVPHPTAARVFGGSFANSGALLLLSSTWSIDDDAHDQDKAYIGFRCARYTP